MALKRYPGNRFDGDTLSDRSSVPTTLPNGTTFLDLETRNEYVLNNGNWSLKGGGFTTRGSFSTSAFDLTLFQDNTYISGDSYNPSLIVPMANDERGTFIWGSKFTNYLTNFHQRGNVEASTNGGIFTKDQHLTYRLTDTAFSQVKGTYGIAERLGSEGETRYTFTATGNIEILPVNHYNIFNRRYTVFCILDSLTGRPTGLYVDFTTGGNWFQATGITGSDFFIGTTCRLGEVPFYSGQNITGVRFRINTPSGPPLQIRELGIWSKDAIPTYYTHAFLNLPNHFQQSNIFGSTLIISGGTNGTPTSGQVLTALDSQGTAVWRNPTVGTIYREFFVSGSTINSGTIVNIPNSRTYETGTNKLHVYVNGAYKRINPSSTDNSYDYWEHSRSGIRLTKSVPPDQPIGFVIFN